MISGFYRNVCSFLHLVLNLICNLFELEFGVKNNVSEFGLQRVLFVSMPYDNDLRILILSTAQLTIRIFFGKLLFSRLYLI